MVLLSCVDDGLMFSTSKNEIDEVYASIQSDFNIEDAGVINKYFGIDLDLHPDASIYIRRPYPTQKILNMIPRMDKSSDQSTPAVKPHLAKK